MTRDDYIKILKDNYESNDIIAIKVIDRGDVLLYCDRNDIQLSNDEIEEILILIDKHFDNHFKYFKKVIKESIKATR